MTARRTLSRVAVALALLIVVAAIVLHFSRRDEREYAEKLEGYEKGESEYAKLARTTGGDELFLDPDTDLSAFLGETKLDAVIRRRIGVVDGRDEVEVPVDASVRRLGLSILGSSGRDASPFTLAAVEPGGRRVEGTSDGVHATLTRNGAIYVIEDPAPGTWKLSFSGRGSYQLAVKAESDLSWGEVRFVSKGGRPGHEGWFPVSGRLESGSEQTFQARIAGTLPEEPEIWLVDEFGSEVERAILLSREENGDGVEILGRVRAPKRAFRFAFRAGAAERVFDEIFDPAASQRTFAWLYRSSTPESDCALVDYLVLTAHDTREITQIIWACVYNRTAMEVATTASATLLIPAGELPGTGVPLTLEALNQLGNGPRELSREDCERYAALFEKLDADAGAHPPPPTLRARCDVAGATSRLRLVVTPVAR